jgi:TolA-binding protein
MKKLMLLLIICLTATAFGEQSLTENLTPENMATSLSKPLYTKVQVRKIIDEVVRIANERIEETAKKAVVVAVEPLNKKIEKMETTIEELNDSVALLQDENSELKLDKEKSEDTVIALQKNANRHFFVTAIVTILSLGIVLVTLFVG